MGYKSIIAVASGDDSDSPLLNAAARLAGQCGALVRVMPAYPDPAADLIAFGATLKGSSEALSERVREGERGQQQRLESRVTEAAARAGITSHAKPGGAAIVAEARALMPAAAIAEAAVLADLVMFAGDAARDALSAPFAETLLQTRAPILVVKDDEFSLVSVALAWDGSAEAGRAARAAAPLLGLAEEVVVVQNVADMGARSKTAAASDGLADYLGRHGVKRVRRLAVEGDDVAGSLLRAAHGERCSALVAGAYGRPRLYELALGGTTRALVNSTDRMHIFLAH